MKFSFDYQDYRKNLADELKEKRKDSRKDAKDLLNKEKLTDAYEVSKDAKRVNFEIENVTGEKELNTMGGNKKTVFESDLSGKLQIEEIDVKDKFSEDFWLRIDKRRLDEIGKYEDSLIYKENPHRSMGDEILEKLTEGDFINPERLINVQDGYFSPKNLLIHHPLSFHKVGKTTGKMINKLPKFISNSDKESDRVMVPTNRDGYELPSYFSAGGTHFYSDFKPIIICNPFSEKFKKILLKAESFDGSVNIQKDLMNRESLIPDEEIKKATAYANKDKSGGIKVIFKRKATVFDIADWVIDLRNRKIIKITRVKEEKGD